MKPHYVLAAIDVNRPENSKVRRIFNITGFPTIIYFENGAQKYVYEGENNKEAIVSFMKNPNAPPPTKPKEEEWATDPDSEVVHLGTNNFDSVLVDEKSALVMFYAVNIFFVYSTPTISANPSQVQHKFSFVF